MPDTSDPGPLPDGPEIPYINARFGQGRDLLKEMYPALGDKIEKMRSDGMQDNEIDHVIGLQTQRFMQDWQAQAQQKGMAPHDAQVDALHAAYKVHGVDPAGSEFMQLAGHVAQKLGGAYGDAVNFGERQVRKRFAEPMIEGWDALNVLGPTQNSWTALDRLKKGFKGQNEDNGPGGPNDPYYNDPRVRRLSEGTVKAQSLGTARPEDVRPQGVAPPASVGMPGNIALGIAAGATQPLNYINPGKGVLKFLAQNLAGAAPFLENEKAQGSLGDQALNIGAQLGTNVALSAGVHGALKLPGALGLTTPGLSDMDLTLGKPGEGAATVPPTEKTGFRARLVKAAATQGNDEFDPYGVYKTIQQMRLKRLAAEMPKDQLTLPGTDGEPVRPPAKDGTWPIASGDKTPVVPMQAPNNLLPPSVSPAGAVPMDPLPGPREDVSGAHPDLEPPPAIIDRTGSQRSLFPQNTMSPPTPGSAPPLRARIQALSKMPDKGLAGITPAEPDKGLFGSIYAAASEKFRNTFPGRYFSSNTAAPEGAVALNRIRKGRISATNASVSALADILSRLPGDVREAAGNVLSLGDQRGNLQDVWHPEFQAKVAKAVELIDPAVREIKRNQELLVDLGVLKPGELTDLGGQYFRRQYLSKLAGSRDVWQAPTTTMENAKQYLMKQGIGEADAESYLNDLAAGKHNPDIMFPGSDRVPLAMKTSNLMARQAIPPEIRAFMGEVKDGGLKALLTLADSTSASENARFLRAMATRLPEWTSPADKLVDMRADTRLSPLQQRMLGPLTRQPVPQWFADMVHEMFYANEGFTKDFNQSMIGKGVNKTISYLKYKTTVLNPSSWTHHTSGISFDAHLGGWSPFNPDNFKYYIAALDEIIKNGPVFQQALKDGAIEPGAFQIGGHKALLDLAQQVALEQTGDPNGLMRGIYRGIKNAGEAAGDARATLDPWFRLAGYMKAIDPQAGLETHDILAAKALGAQSGVRQLSGVEAATHINKFMPAYGEVGSFWKAIGREPVLSLTNNPFFRMNVEQFKVLKNAAAQHPIRTTALMGSIYAASHWGHIMNAVTDGDYKEAAKAENSRASYQESPAMLSVLLPGIRDRRGKMDFLNLSHDLPFGQWLTGEGWDPRKTTLENLGAQSAAMTDKLVSHGFLDDYSGGEKPGDELGQSLAQKAGKYVWDRAVPPPFQTTGMVANVYRSTQSNKGPFHEPRTPEQAILGGVGFPTFEADPKRENVEYKGRVKELDTAKTQVKSDYKAGKFLGGRAEEQSRMQEIRQRRQRLQKAEQSKRKSGVDDSNN